MPIDLAAVAEEHRPRAGAALREAFPRGDVDGLSPGPAGASGATTYRVHRAAGDALLRLEGDRLPGRNPHQYRNLRAAADAGIAPPVLVADDDAGVIVMGWIDARPLTDHPGGPAGLAAAVGALLAQVQRLPAFPPHDDWAQVVAGMLAHLEATGRFAPGVLDRPAAVYARLRAAWPRDPADAVPAHNDPNAQNLLYDGARLWLVDWETSAPNDPLVDLAVAANQLAPTPELADALLAAWRGAPPDELLRARLLLAQQAAKLFAAGALALVDAAAEPQSDLDAPTMHEFTARLADGSVTMGAPGSLVTLAKVVINDVLATAGSAEFAAALRVSAAG